MYTVDGIEAERFGHSRVDLYRWARSSWQSSLACSLLRRPLRLCTHFEQWNCVATSISLYYSPSSLSFSFGSFTSLFRYLFCLSSFYTHASRSLFHSHFTLRLLSLCLAVCDRNRGINREASDRLKRCYKSLFSSPFFLRSLAPLCAPSALQLTGSPLISRLSVQGSRGIRWATCDPTYYFSDHDRNDSLGEGDPCEIERHLSTDRRVFYAFEIGKLNGLWKFRERRAWKMNCINWFCSPAYLSVQQRTSSRYLKQ